MRGSYSGNTLAFQAKARSSILLPRSRFAMNLRDGLGGDQAQGDVRLKVGRRLCWQVVKVL